MRITVLCTDLGVRVPGDKGASMHLQSISLAFASIGHEVQLLGVAGHGAPPTDLAEVHLLPHPGRAEGLVRERNKVAFTRAAVATFTPLVRDFAPQLIYERLSLFGDAGVQIASMAPSATHALEVNALLAEEEARWRGLHMAELATSIEQRVLAASDVVVAVSDEVARRVRSTATPSHCVVVPNGAEVERFRALPKRGAARKSLGLPTAAPLACFVGALRPWHGVDVAIRAVACTDDLHLVIVGDGPVRADLERTAEVHGVAHRVHFLGHRDPVGVGTALAAADVAVAPYPASDSFSFSPLKLYEYLAAGTPVVASAIGQIPEALGHGRWGTLVPPGDIEALSLAMSFTARSPEALAKAAAGRAHALAHHGWDDRARRIVEACEVDRAVV